MSRYDLLKADVEDHLDIIQDNLTNMEGCFEILIPKNDFVHDDIDFDALMRGEASSKQTQNDAYKEVSKITVSNDSGVKLNLFNYRI